MTKLKDFFITPWGYKLFQLLCFISCIVVGFGGYYAVYNNYPFIMTHPREDASLAVGFFCYLAWKLAITPDKES